jgi:hypothetical protein
VLESRFHGARSFGSGRTSAEGRRVRSIVSLFENRVPFSAAYAQSRICPDLDSLTVRVAVRLVSENMTDLTQQLLLAVPCPTCGVDAGKHCLLHTGELSPDPHIDRTLDATEAIETEKIPIKGER